MVLPRSCWGRLPPTHLHFGVLTLRVQQGSLAVAATRFPSPSHRAQQAAGAGGLPNRSSCGARAISPAGNLAHLPRPETSLSVAGSSLSAQDREPHSEPSLSLPELEWWTSMGRMHTLSLSNVKRSAPQTSKGGSHGPWVLVCALAAAPLPCFCWCIPQYLWRPQWCHVSKKRLSQAPSLVSSVPDFPGLKAIMEPSRKAGFGGILAPRVWSMHLHSSLPWGAPGFTSQPCTRSERWDDISVCTPTWRALRLFMSKMCFGHEGHYNKC